MTQEKQMDKQGKNEYKIDTEYNYIQWFIESTVQIL